MAQLEDGDFAGTSNNGLQFLRDLATELAALRVDYNAHVHTENTAASYTQNASTSVASVLIPASIPSEVVDPNAF